MIGYRGNRVYLDDKHIGSIFPVLGGYQYFPKGGSGGEVFPSIGMVEASIEGDEMSSRKAEAVGVSAFLGGLPITSNPFEESTDNWGRFRDGWHQEHLNSLQRKCKEI